LHTGQYMDVGAIKRLLCVDFGHPLRTATYVAQTNQPQYSTRKSDPRPTSMSVVLQRCAHWNKDQKGHREQDGADSHDPDQIDLHRLQFEPRRLSALYGGPVRRRLLITGNCHGDQPSSASLRAMKSRSTAPSVSASASR
jgi:hypothetical protein